MTEHQYFTGQVVWRELMTRDAERAKGFYGELCGWKFEAMPMPDGSSYTFVKLGEQAIGGIQPLGADMAQVPAHWASFVSVEDVDATAAAAKEHGGSVVFGPMDLPGMVKLAGLADPQGAHFFVVRSYNGDHVYAQPPLGSFCWETLSTSDPEAAKAFYGEVLGWETGPAPGDHGYVFKVPGGPAICDVQPAEHAPPNMLTYIVVENADKARARAEKLGAKILMERIEVPTVGTIAVVADPTGAVVGLFQPQMG